MIYLRGDGGTTIFKSNTAGLLFNKQPPAQSAHCPRYQGSLFIRGARCGPKRATVAMSVIKPATPRHRAATTA